MSWSRPRGTYWAWFIPYSLSIFFLATGKVASNSGATLFGLKLHLEQDAYHPPMGVVDVFAYGGALATAWMTYRSQVIKLDSDLYRHFIVNHSDYADLNETNHPIVLGGFAKYGIGFHGMVSTVIVSICSFLSVLLLYHGLLRHNHDSLADQAEQAVPRWVSVVAYWASLAAGANFISFNIGDMRKNTQSMLDNRSNWHALMSGPALLKGLLPAALGSVSFGFFLYYYTRHAFRVFPLVSEFSAMGNQVSGITSAALCFAFFAMTRGYSYYQIAQEGSLPTPLKSFKNMSEGNQLLNVCDRIFGVWDSLNIIISYHASIADLDKGNSTLYWMAFIPAICAAMLNYAFVVRRVWDRCVVEKPEALPISGASPSAG